MTPCAKLQLQSEALRCSRFTSSVKRLFSKTIPNILCLTVEQNEMIDYTERGKTFICLPQRECWTILVIFSLFFFFFTQWWIAFHKRTKHLKSYLGLFFFIHPVVLEGGTFYTVSKVAPEKILNQKSVSKKVLLVWIYVTSRQTVFRQQVYKIKTMLNQALGLRLFLNSPSLFCSVQPAAAPRTPNTHRAGTPPPKIQFAWHWRANA